VLLCVALLTGGLVLLLLLNISLSRGAYELYRGQAQLSRLEEQRQATEEDLLAQQAPQELAARARGSAWCRRPTSRSSGWATGGFGDADRCGPADARARPDADRGADRDCRRRRPRRRATAIALAPAVAPRR
jgi:hypothetical protein